MLHFTGGAVLHAKAVCIFISQKRGVSPGADHTKVQKRVVYPPTDCMNIL